MTVRETYTLLDHTADLRIRIFGKNLADLFKNAGLALFDLMIETDSSAATEEIEIHVAGADPADLLINFLRELLFLWTGEEKVVTMITITTLSETAVAARVNADPYMLPRHHVIKEIKAVTYHQAEVFPTKKGWQATVVLDV